MRGPTRLTDGRIKQLGASSLAGRRTVADMETDGIPKADASLQAAEGSNGLAGCHEMVASSGISLRLWRLYAYFWLICLFFPILALAQMQATLEQWSIALAGLLLFVIGYAWIMWPHPLSSAARARAQSRTARLLSVMLTALVLALSLAYGSAFLWLFVGVSAIVGITLPARSAFVVVMLLTLL